MDEVTQQNSAMVEENAATARTLEQQAGAMDERIGAYKLDGAGASARTVTPMVKRAAPRASAPVRKPAARMVARSGAAAAVKEEWEEF